MGQTANGYPYPELTDTPDVPRDVRALAEAVDARAALALDGDVVVGGYFVKQVTPGSGGQAVITMSGWAERPVVVAILQTQFNFNLAMGDVTATQANFFILNSATGAPFPDGTQIAFTVIAFGTPSGAARPTLS